MISSSLSSVGYDHSTGEMHVEFKSGKIAVYQGVAAHVFRNMIRAPSIGSFHATHVAKTYRFRLVR